jgi:hypothetical protein
VARTQANGSQIADGSIQRSDLDATTAGAAVVRRLIAGTGVTFSSTGPDVGTGDVTINAASSGVAAPVVARMYRGTTQSIPSGAGWTDLSWSAAAYQVNGTFWTSGATITIPETGYYQLSASAVFDGANLATTNRDVYIRALLNGSTIIGAANSPIAALPVAEIVRVSINELYSFTAGATVLIQANHSEPSGALDVITQGSYSPEVMLQKVNGAKGDTGAAGGLTTGIATIDFGVFPGANEASVVVTGQSSILSGSAPSAQIMAVANGATTADDAAYVSTLCGVACGAPTAASGFTINARSEHKLQGPVSVRWFWA